MHNYNFWLFIMVCKEHILETLAFKEWISITGRNVFSMSKWRQGVIEVPKTVYQQAMLELSQLLLMTATTYVTVKIPSSAFRYQILQFLCSIFDAMSCRRLGDESWNHLPNHGT